jgi:hypothetical protein
MSGIDDAGNGPASADVPVPANWADQWDAPVRNAAAAPVGTVSDPGAPMTARIDQDSVAATPPAPSLWDRIGNSIVSALRRSGRGAAALGQTRGGAEVPIAMAQNAWDSVVDAGRIMTTPPPQLPPHVHDSDSGYVVKQNGQWVAWQEAEPEAARAYADELRKREELPMRTALAMLGIGTGFAQRGALGAAGGRLRGPPFKDQPPRLPNRPGEPNGPRPVEPVREGGAAANADRSSFAGQVSAPANVLENAKFAQPGHSRYFHPKGKFQGRLVKDVVEDIKNGVINPSDIEINYVIRDGNPFIMNTRSSEALKRAGIPRHEWKAVNKTGNRDYERELNDRMQEHGFTSSGGFTTGFEEPEGYVRPSIVRRARRRGR